MKIVLASNNKHKVKEIKKILNEYEIITLNDIEYFDEIEETGSTFLENALIKAKTISNYLKSKGIEANVIADDSGLCVNALNGEPGVYSARYAGDHDTVKNRIKLINNLKNKEDKSAYFVCLIVEYYPNDTYTYVEGKTQGVILDEERGDTSFGFDCVFYSNELHKTFGEATSEEKNSVSHRARAIQLLKSIKKDGN